MLLILLGFVVVYGIGATYMALKFKKGFEQQRQMTAQANATILKQQNDFASMFGGR
jgi:nitrate reductase gamma subunit